MPTWLTFQQDHLPHPACLLSLLHAPAAPGPRPRCGIVCGPVGRAGAASPQSPSRQRRRPAAPAASIPHATAPAVCHPQEPYSRTGLTCRAISLPDTVDSMLRNLVTISAVAGIGYVRRLRRLRLRREPATGRRWELGPHVAELMPIIRLGPYGPRQLPADLSTGW